MGQFQQSIHWIIAMHPPGVLNQVESSQVDGTGRRCIANELKTGQRLLTHELEHHIDLWPPSRYFSKF